MTLTECPDCGKGLPVGAEMCLSCGFPLANYEPPAICPDCGEESPGNALFCEKCGYPLLENAGFDDELPVRPSSKPKSALHIAVIAVCIALVIIVSNLDSITNRSILEWVIYVFYAISNVLDFK